MASTPADSVSMCYLDWIACWWRTGTVILKWDIRIDKSLPYFAARNLANLRWTLHVINKWQSHCLLATYVLKWWKSQKQMSGAMTNTCWSSSLEQRPTPAACSWSFSLDLPNCSVFVVDNYRMGKSYAASTRIWTCKSAFDGCRLQSFGSSITSLTECVR